MATLAIASFTPFDTNYTDPAAGVIATLPVLRDVIFRGVAFSLITSAAVAIRTVNITIQNAGGFSIFSSPATDTQIASLTRFYSGAEYGLQPAAISNVIYFNIPRFTISRGGSIVISVQNLQGADQISLVTLNHQPINNP